MNTSELRRILNSDEFKETVKAIEQISASRPLFPVLLCSLVSQKAIKPVTSQTSIQPDRVDGTP